jgi:hypothetical protein
LDREEKYLQMQKEENLEIERRECIQDFFEMRHSMLLDQVQCRVNDQKSGDESSQPKKSKEITKSFENFSELANDTMPFEFDTLLPGGASADSDDAFSKMIEWDTVLLKRMNCSRDTSAAEVLSSLKYEIESGPGGIALNKNGDAFCRVELYVHVPSSSNTTRSDQASGKRKVLLSGICAFTFGSQSSRLTSLKLTILEDRCFVGLSRSTGGEMDSNSSQPSRDNLGSQLVHPSVVSLDHVRHVELDESHGPGMNI